MCVCTPSLSLLEIPLNLLEVPLNGQCRVDKERLVIICVVNKIITNFYLRADTEMAGCIEPELWFGKDDEHAVALMTWAPVFTAPEIDEAREGTFLVGEVQAAHARELEAAVGRGVVVALEELLVHELHRPGFREVGIMAVVGTTEEGGMLETADLIATQTSIILRMDGEG